MCIHNDPASKPPLVRARGSSPPPSSWSSWTPRSSASPCRRCRPTSASPRRTCPGCSTPTSSRSAGCCCSAAACPTCSAPAGCSPPAGSSCSPVPLVAGAAGNVGVELAGRAVQGAGAALIAPSALTLLMMLFGCNPRELTKALRPLRRRRTGRRHRRGVPRRRHHRVRQLAVGVLHQHPDRRSSSLAADARR